MKGEPVCKVSVKEIQALAKKIVAENPGGIRPIMRLLWVFIALIAVPAVAAGQAGQQVKLVGTLDGARPAVYSTVAFSPDGKILACIDGPKGGAVQLWDLEKRKVIATLRPETDVRAVAFSNDGKTLAAVAHQQVTLWDVAKGKKKATFKGHTGRVFSVAFNPDGKTLATGGEGEGMGGLGPGELKLWDLAANKEKASLTGNPGPVFSVAFSADRKVLASGSGEFGANGQPGAGEVKLWGVATGLERASLKGQGKQGLGVVWSVAISPDGKTLASADVYGWILLWDIQSGKRIATLQAFNPAGKDEDINGAFSVAFSPDGKTLAAGTWRGIKFWDVKSGKKLGDANGSSAVVWSVAFNRDGKTVVSAGTKKEVDPVRGSLGEYGTIRLWELTSTKKGDQ